MKKLAGLCAALAAFGLVACGGGAEKEVATGGLELSISGPSAVESVTGALRQAATSGTPDAASKIANVNLWAEGLEAACQDGWFATLPYAPTFPITDKITRMPACKYVFHATAVDAAGKVLYEASAPITVFERQMSALNLVLQQKVAPGSVDVTAPMISGIAITGTYPPVIGKPVTLAATVSNAPAPTYLWTVSCASDPYPYAPFSAPNALSSNLTLQQCEGDATVTFTVSDATISGAGGSMSSTVSFVLRYVKQGTDLQSLTINSWPNISAIRAVTNAQPLPGGTVGIVAAASDPDNDALEFTWSDDCGGSFSGSDPLAPVWTAPATAGAKCVLTLKADEKDTNAAGHTDGTNSATLTINVGTPIWTATTWLYDANGVYDTVTSQFQTDGSLLLEKRGSGSDWTSAGVRLSGAPEAFSSLSFDIVSGACVGGAPRFNVYLDDSTSPCFLGCNNVTPVGSTYTFTPDVNGCGTGQITRLDLMVDWPAGPVVLDNIKVNGNLVTF